LAAVKPVLCLPLFIGLLVYRRWGPFLAASLVVVLLNAVGFWSSDEPLGVHLRNYIGTGSYSMHRGYGPNSLLAVVGLPSSVFLFAGLVAVVAFFWGLSRFRGSLWKENPLTFLALSCFAGRAWFPSFAHDNVMFIPMLVAVVARVYQDPRFEGVTLAALLGSSLWIPGRWMNSSSGIELFQWAVWLYAISFLCRECSARSRCISDRSFARPKEMP